MNFDARIFILLLTSATCPNASSPASPSTKKLPTGETFRTRLSTLLADDTPLIEVARDLYKRQYYKEALPYFTRAIKKNPSKPEYFIARAKCYLRINNTTKAINDFKTIISQAENPINNQILMCKTLIDFNKIDEARKEIQSIENHNILLETADEFCAMTQFEAAFIFYNEAIRKYPHERYYRRRGHCHDKKHDMKMAILDYKAAVSVPNEYKDNMTRRLLIDKLLYSESFDDAMKEMHHLDYSELEQLAEVHREHEQYKEAACFYTALIAKRTHEKYFRLRGKCYREMGNLDTALLDFMQAVSLPAEDSDHLTRNILVETLIELENFDEGVKEMGPMDYVEILKLGDKFCSQKKFKGAICLYTNAIAKYPHEKCYRSRGLCYLKMENWNEAISDFKQAVSLPTDDKDNLTHTLLIETLVASGNTYEAQEEMDTLEEAELVKQGDKFCSEKKYDEALYAYGVAIKRNPSSPPYASRAMCYVRMGKFSEALSDFDEVVKKDPRPESAKKNLSRILLCCVLYELGRNKDAENEMKDFDVSQLTMLADELYERQMFVQAGQCYTAAVKKGGKNAAPLLKRGQYYRKRNYWQAAIYDYEDAVRIDKSCIDCWIDLAELYLENKEFARAKYIMDYPVVEYRKLNTVLPENENRLEIVRKKVTDWEQAESVRAEKEERERRRKAAQKAEQEMREMYEEDEDEKKKGRRGHTTKRLFLYA